MTHQPRLRCIIRICISARKAQSRIPRIRRRHILGTQRTNFRFRIRTRGLRCRIRIACISQLITDAIGDNIRIKCFLLAFVD